MGAQGSTFFRKKFLPDFLSPLLVRTPRCRMYRLMALTTAALWGGDGEGEGMVRAHGCRDPAAPTASPPLASYPCPTTLPAGHLSKGRERRF